jgi:flagellar hook-associated protein FlgK
LQESYQAASKMLNVIDNLTQTVLGLISPSSVT